MTVNEMDMLFFVRHNVEHAMESIGLATGGYKKDTEYARVLMDIYKTLNGVDEKLTDMLREELICRGAGC